MTFIDDVQMYFEMNFVRKKKNAKKHTALNEVRGVWRVKIITLHNTILYTLLIFCTNYKQKRILAKWKT